MRPEKANIVSDLSEKINRSPFLLVTDIGFGLELFADGTFAVVEHGVNLTGPLGVYAAGARFAIAVTGGVQRLSTMRSSSSGVTEATNSSVSLCTAW